MSNSERKAANQPAGIEEDHARVNDQAIQYLKSGTGPAPMLVHGYS